MDVAPQLAGAGTLLRLGARTARRRLQGGGRALGVLASVAALGTAFAMGVALDALAAADVAWLASDAPAPEARLRAVVMERGFWLNALAVLVFAYTTFDQLFRDPARRFLVTLPLDPRARFTAATLGALGRHLPLVLPALAYSAALTWRGAPSAGAYVAMLVGSTYVLGIPLATTLHLLAGRSLLSGGSSMKKAMGSGLVEDDAALLMWSPAAALLVPMVLAIFAELSLADAFFGEHPDRALYAPAVAAIGAALAFKEGRRVAGDALYPTLLRFLEADTQLAVTPSGEPKPVAGESLATRLPAAARAAFRRDLRQLARRHRLDRLLGGVFVLAVFRLVGDADAPALSAAAPVVGALALLQGVGLATPLRLAGPELGSPWLDTTLPPPVSATGAPIPAWRGPALGRLVAGLLVPLASLATAAAAVALLHGAAAAAWTLGLGLTTSVALETGALALSRAVAAHAIARASLAWRGAVLFALGGLTWLST